MIAIKIAVVSLKKHLIEKDLSKYNLQIDRKKPNVVICLGGDGTLLYGEQIYPGIPKLMIYHQNTCTNCKNHDFSKILKKLSKIKYKKQKLMKLEGSVNGKKIIAMNDINFHYKPPCAVRFDLYVNNKKLTDIVIGDGLVIATPWGSNAYYKSITRKTFKNGIGIAFNNPTRKMKDFIISPNSKVRIKVLRGPAYLAADCNKKIIPLKTGDSINVFKSGDKAVLLGERIVSY